MSSSISSGSGSNPWAEYDLVMRSLEGLKTAPVNSRYDQTTGEFIPPRANDPPLKESAGRQSNFCRGILLTLEHMERVAERLNQDIAATTAPKKTGSGNVTFNLLETETRVNELKGRVQRLFHAVEDADLKRHLEELGENHTWQLPELFKPEELQSKNMRQLWEAIKGTLTTFAQDADKLIKPLALKVEGWTVVRGREAVERKPEGRLSEWKDSVVSDNPNDYDRSIPLAVEQQLKKKQQASQKAEEKSPRMQPAAPLPLEEARDRRDESVAASAEAPRATAAAETAKARAAPEIRSSTGESLGVFQHHLLSGDATSEKKTAKKKESSASFLDELKTKTGARPKAAAPTNSVQQRLKALREMSDDLVTNLIYHAATVNKEEDELAALKPLCTPTAPKPVLQGPPLPPPPPPVPGAKKKAIVPAAQTKPTELTEAEQKAEKLFEQLHVELAEEDGILGEIKSRLFPEDPGIEIATDNLLEVSLYFISEAEKLIPILEAEIAKGGKPAGEVAEQPSTVVAAKPAALKMSKEKSDAIAQHKAPLDDYHRASREIADITHEMLKQEKKLAKAGESQRAVVQTLRSHLASGAANIKSTSNRELLKNNARLAEEVKQLKELCLRLKAESADKIGVLKKTQENSLKEMRKLVPLPAGSPDTRSVDELKRDIEAKIKEIMTKEDSKSSLDSLLEKTRAAYAGSSSGEDTSDEWADDVPLPRGGSTGSLTGSDSDVGSIGSESPNSGSDEEK